MYTRVPGASRVAWKQDSKQSHWVSVFSPLSLISPSPLLISLPICLSLYLSLSSPFLLPSLLHFSPSSTPLPNFLFPLTTLLSHLSLPHFPSPISLHFLSLHLSLTPFLHTFAPYSVSNFCLSSSSPPIFLCSSISLPSSSSPTSLPSFFISRQLISLCATSLASMFIPFMTSSYRLCHGFLHIVGDVA